MPASFIGAANKGADAAAAAMAMPFRKSRRVMERSIPSARSVNFLLCWSVMNFPERVGSEAFFGPPSYPVRATTCQRLDTVYNDSHCLHIHVTHDRPHASSNSYPQAHSRRYCRKRYAAYP